MKLHIITVGKPKLPYAQEGWQEYWPRLGRYHDLTATHILDRHSDPAGRLLQAAGNSYKVALDGGGEELSSEGLAEFLGERAMHGPRVSFMIGGPDGLPDQVIKQADFRWSLGELTYPHDLAMIITLEALYRASSINAGHPYHRG